MMGLSPEQRVPAATPALLATRGSRETRARPAESVLPGRLATEERPGWPDHPGRRAPVSAQRGLPVLQGLTEILGRLVSLAWSGKLALPVPVAPVGL